MFNGLAIHSTGRFSTTADDVSEMISMISPYETPFLDALSQAEREASNVLHEWLEESLGPNTIVSSTGHTDASSAVFAVHAEGSSEAVTPYLQVGMILKNDTGGDYLQISAISGNTITCLRAFGGTSATTIAVGTTFSVISDAALEGADVTVDISKPRVRKTNYTQIFKKDVIVSGTMQAVTHLGISDEYDHQVAMRLREAIRDLEKASISGILSGNTIGTVALTRTMKGLMASITTNVRTDLDTLTSIGQVEDLIQMAWGNGAEDLDLIVCDNIKKRQLSALQFPRVTVEQASSAVDVLHERVSTLETDYGTHRLLRSRWMPANSMVVLSSNRVRVVPLQGRTYRHVPVAPTGDASKGMILGEYTMEVKNEEGMAKAV